MLACASPGDRQAAHDDRRVCSGGAPPRGDGPVRRAGFATRVDGTPFSTPRWLAGARSPSADRPEPFTLPRASAPPFVPLLDYRSPAIRRCGPGVAEIDLTPLGRRSASPRPVAMLTWRDRRLPQSIHNTRSPAEKHLRFAIKALRGRTPPGSARVVKTGMPAVIRRPLRPVSHKKGTVRPVWIAVGNRVTPFLSWMRALDTSHCEARSTSLHLPQRQPALCRGNQGAAGRPRHDARAHRQKQQRRATSPAERVLATH